MVRYVALAALVLVAAACPVAQAETLGAPVSARLGDAAVLALQGATLSDRDYQVISDPVPGRPCPAASSDRRRDQLTGGVTGGRVRVSVVSRSTNVCLYRVRVNEGGEVIEDALAGERRFDVPFAALPREPLNVGAGTRAFGRREPSVGFALDTRGRTRRVRISPGAPLAYGQLQCSRKRFLFPRAIDMSGWGFRYSGPLIADNTANYDTPLPPRYGGRARVTITGRLEYVAAGELRVVAQLRFAAPGLRGAAGTPNCPRITGTITGQVEIPVSG